MVSAPVEGQPAVNARNLVKDYGSAAARVRALDDVSLQVPAGSWLAVMGPSGSGKSTLLHCLAGLERPDSGRVQIGDLDLTAASEDALTRMRRTQIGFVFQNFNLISALTAAQNVALPLRLAGQRPSRAEVRAALEAVGLGDRGGNRPGQLSGGQQQRVAIARALITRPDILFADEPTGALDSATAVQMLGLLRQIVQHGQTIVCVTHDPVVAASADAVVVLRDGRIVEQWVQPTAEQIAGRMTDLGA